jgi:pyruvate formate lyase activating enzyme
MKKAAKFWEKLPDKKVRCTLCPRNCIIAPGKIGFCRVRKNEGGELYTLVYGSIVSMAVDPIEKKPLYHFWPGSGVFSIATAGCNFKCDFCQNWSISQVGIEDIAHEELPPERVVELTKRYDCKGIAFTYAEPSTWWEYCYDVAKLAHREGLYNVYVTNGYMSLEAWEEIRPYLDGANVDVKAFSDRFYRKFPGVPSIKPVLETCEWLVEHGKHLETTYLVVPRENDSPEEIRKFCKWVFEKLGPEVPTHFSRFYPHYKVTDRAQTPIEALERAVKIARGEGLHHVYIGNVPGHEFDNTYCPKCGELLVERYGFSVTRYELKDKQCPKCGNKINIVGEYKPSKRGWF